MIDLALLLAVIAAPPPAPVKVAWVATSGVDADGDVYRAIVRKNPPFEIELRAVKGFAPNLSVRIHDACNGGDYSNQSSISSEGSAAERAAFLLNDARDMVDDAAKQCAISPDVAAHAMDGFTEAFIKFDPPSGVETTSGPN
jgi:hypothetical protein